MAAVKSADLCRGQRYHWLRYQQMPTDARHDSHIVVSSPLPGGVACSEVRSAINHLVRRHEALRTVLDASADPWPQQLVLPPAPLPVREVTTEPDGTASPADVVRKLTLGEFDLCRDWPIRACLVTTAGAPQRLVLVLNHVAFDDWSLERFRQEFAAMLDAMVAKRRASLSPVALHPTDLARHEAATPPGPATIEHWRREIAALPADTWVRRRRRPAGSAFSASFTSPTLLAAARAIATRHRTWPSTVHLAAYAVTAAAYTGEASVAYQWLTSHRDAAPDGAVMTCMFSPTLITVDLSDDPTFREVLRRTVAQVESAQAHAYIAYDDIVEELVRESARRGQPVRVASEINFLSHPDQACGVRRDRLTWNAPPLAWAASGCDTYLQLHEWRDCATVSLYATDAVMDRTAVERFLRGYAELILAHLDEDTDLPLPEAAARMRFAAAQPRRLVPVGRDVIDATAVETVLHGFAGVTSARVTGTPHGNVTADVTHDGTVDAEALRGHVLDAMYAVPAVRCPDLLRMTGPDGATVGWSANTRPARTARPPATEAEKALAAVVEDLNGIGPVDLAECYTTAGGRVLRIPRVLAALEALGWHGLDPRALASARPLRMLACALTRR